MRLTDNLRSLARTDDRKANNVIIPDPLTVTGGRSPLGGESDAMKLSAVSRCVDILSDSIGKLPVYVYDENTRARVDHPVLSLLSGRPNPAQTPYDAKKMIEKNRLCSGNGYAIIVRDPRTLRPVQLIPVQGGSVSVRQDNFGELHYTVVHPWTKAALQLESMDMIHVKGLSRDGYKGVSVLERASSVIAAGRSAQEFSVGYYQNGGHPSGVLQADADLSGFVDVPSPDGTTTVKRSKKQMIREEWERVHSGPDNAGRVAVLDFGLKYQPLTISNRDAQFVEQAAVTVEDIARFFGVPLYKLQAGKQSYSSNEQNAIEYIVGTLMPIVTEWEEELSYKLLTDDERKQGLRIKINVMAELRGDFASRSAWYRGMREAGVFSVNEIRALEDMESCEGGDERYASLNYVPLSEWKRLSENRNGGNA